MARVLIVDDERVMRELLEGTLEDAGHAVESVENGRAALERLAQRAYDTPKNREHSDGCEQIKPLLLE